MSANKDFRTGPHGRPIRAPVLLPDAARKADTIQTPGDKSRPRRLATVGLSVALGLTATALLHCSASPRAVDRSRLTIATVQRGTFVRDIVADGQVVMAESPTLYVPVAGTVALKVRAGDAVDNGELLAVVDSPDLMAKLAQEEATLNGLRVDWLHSQLQAAQKLARLREALSQAEVDRKTSQRELERSRKAYELGSYSELQELKAQDALEKAQFAASLAKLSYDAQPQENRFNIDSQKALFDRQQLMVGDLRRQVAALQIHSPMKGKVGQVRIADRATVARDAALLAVVDLSALEVLTRMPEVLARDLIPGLAVYLKEGGGKQWKGSVSSVSPEIVNGEVVVRLRFSGPKPEGLHPSQHLSVRIFIERLDNVLMANRGNFVGQDGGRFAYVIHGTVAERRRIDLGAVSAQEVEILDGVEEGEQIVVSGADAFNGAPRVILQH